MAKEKDAIRKFVVAQLQKCSDLSTLTLGILRRRYLEKVGRESLSAQDRQLMKVIVEEELLKMQASSDDEPLIKMVNPSKTQSKRKRVDDEDDEEEERKVMDRTKRSRLEESPPPDSPDSGIEKAMNEVGHKEEAGSDKDTDEDSEEEEKEKMKGKPQKKKGGKKSPQVEDNRKKKKLKKKTIESDEDEELEDSDEEERQKPKEKEDSDSEEAAKSDSASDSEDEKPKSKTKTPSKRKDIRKKKPVERDVVKEVEREVFGSSSESEEEKNQRAKIKNGSISEDESAGDSDEERDKSEDIAGLPSKETKNNEKLRDGQEEAEDSDSSSLPSLEDEEEQEKEKTKKEGKKSMRKKSSEERENTSRGKDEENKAVSRLKRYIALCGVRRNYKKLLDGCRSVKAKVAVLKKELEELGVEGQPSIEKCKKARLKREEAQELAELDMSNIITTQGRPKRRAAAAVWPPAQNASPPSSAYKRVVDSDSDSGDSHTNRGRKRGAWANLHGIISDDGDSE